MVSKAEILARTAFTAVVLSVPVPIYFAFPPHAGVSPELSECINLDTIQSNPRSADPNPDMESFFKVSNSIGQPDRIYRHKLNGIPLEVSYEEFQACVQEASSFESDTKKSEFTFFILSMVGIPVLFKSLVSGHKSIEFERIDPVIDKLLGRKSANGKPLKLRDVLDKLGLEPKEAEHIETLVRFAQNSMVLTATNFLADEDTVEASNRKKAIASTNELLAKVEKQVGAISLKIYNREPVSFDDVLLVAFARKAAEQTHNISRVFTMLGEDELLELLEARYAELNPRVNVLELVERLESGTVSDQLLALVTEMQSFGTPSTRDPHSTLEAIHQALLRPEAPVDGSAAASMGSSSGAVARELKRSF